MIERIFKLDREVYPEEHLSTIEELQDRFNRNKDSYITVTIDDELAGYVCFFPITSSLAAKLEEGIFKTDATISSADILPFDNHEGILYVISAVVAKKFQGSSVVKLLMETFEKRIKHKGFNSIMATAISYKGERVLEKQGFHVLVSNKHGVLMIREQED